MFPGWNEHDKWDGQIWNSWTAVMERNFISPLWSMSLVAVCTQGYLVGRLIPCGVHCCVVGLCRGMDLICTGGCSAALPVGPSCHHQWPLALLSWGQLEFGGRGREILTNTLCLLCCSVCTSQGKAIAQWKALAVQLNPWKKRRREGTGWCWKRRMLLTVCKS